LIDGSSASNGQPHNWRTPWTVAILPQMEQTTLYNQFNLALPFFGRYDHGPGNASYTGAIATNFAAQQVNSPPVYRCPSSPVSNTDKYTNNYNACMGGGTTNTVAFSVDNVPSSVNNATPSYNSAGAASTNVCTPGTPGGSMSDRLFYTNGIIYMNSAISLNNIRDGSTNTVLLGETIYCLLTENYGYAGSNPPNGAWTYWSSSGRNHTGCCPYMNALTGTYQPINNPCVDMNWKEATARGGAAKGHGTMESGFSSWHDGGAHFCLADGSVRFISQNVNLQTFQLLGPRNDQNVLGEF